jgi:hypothetical protein
MRQRRLSPSQSNRDRIRVLGAITGSISGPLGWRPESPVTVLRDRGHGAPRSRSRCSESPVTMLRDPSHGSCRRCSGPCCGGCRGRPGQEETTANANRTTKTTTTQMSKAQKPIVSLEVPADAGVALVKSTDAWHAHSVRPPQRRRRCPGWRVSRRDTEDSRGGARGALCPGPSLSWSESVRVCETD